MDNLLTVKEAAEKIGSSVSFLQKKCKDGTLPARRVGNEYRIHVGDLTSWTTHTPTVRLALPTKTEQSADDLLALCEEWLSYLAHVKALSPNTIRTHKGHFYCHLKRMAALGNASVTVASLFQRKTILTVFATIPAKSYAVKYNTYNALLSFGHFLVEEGKLPAEAIGDVKALKPRRQVEPRRTHLKATEAPLLFETILTRSASPTDNLTVAAMVATMVYAGLRVSEVCNLRLQDVDLEARVIAIRHGKGGKDRRVGIVQALYGYLLRYKEIRAVGPTFFIQPHGEPWTPHMLAKRLRVISKRMGVDITCHGLRRTFATLAAAHGRNINAIRIALGHSNLETTQAYLRTSEAEVVEAMKGW